MLTAFIFGSVFGCGSLAVLVLDIWCIVKIVEGGRATANKVVWIVLVVIFPLIGAIMWLLMGRE